jgi:threonyl-tRNA synthetase
MRRSAPRGPGIVRLRVPAGAEVPHVRLELDEEAYRIAGQAHLVGLPVRVEGRLESRGGFRRLTRTTQVVPVRVDEAERGRPMKSLQENVDHFEEACTGANRAAGKGSRGRRRGPAPEPFRRGGPRLGTIRIARAQRTRAFPLSQERPVSDVRVIIQRDSEREERVVTTGTTAAELFPGERTVVAARVAGELKDLAYVVADGEVVEPVEISSEDGLNILRHSTAHVMAQAVQQLFPEAKLGIGPPVKDGFYYDFDVEKPFTPEDLKAIEKKMQEIQKRGQRFSRRVVTDEAAREELADEPYKLELIGIKGAASSDDGADVEVGGGELTIYDNLDPKSGELCWKDLCRGPHLPTTRFIPAFKLMRNAAAYWRGSEKNPMLQRIYGTAWPTKDELKAHLEFLEEAAKRDHRKLGNELDLFSFPDEIGPGLAVFHPKGGIIRRAMEDYSRRRHEEEGYEFVYSPHATKGKLFEKSGHLDWYADGMYPPMQLDDGVDYYLKPMNCPMHNLIFDARGRSYRELPLRLFEFGTVYRYEKSGVVHGLTRSRGFTQDDAHIYCTKEQMAEELDRTLTFVLNLLRDYGLTDFYLELSTKDPEKFVGSDEIWEEATETLRQVAEKQGLPLVPDPGGAAFYGPKISVQCKDAIGRTWQMSTVQLDFNLPERFDLEYTGPDGSRQRPVMIHRALFGSIERFFAVLLEHYAGAFPAWLAPVQVVGIPITDAHIPYLQEVAAKLRARGVRVDIDMADDRMQKKIRNAQKAKVPYMLLAGDEDASNGAVSFRYRNGEQKNGIPVDEAVAEIVKAIEDRVQV